MELIDIVDENNHLTGQVEERWVAYDKGLWKRTVSCWIMNEEGEILLQKRTANKRRNPNKWAKTGGQVDSGETVEKAIYREVKEELGIEIPKEQIKVVDIYKSDDKNRRFAYNFIFIVDYKVEDYLLQKEEVEEVKYVTIEEMEISRKNHNTNYTFYHWDEREFYREMNLLKSKREEILKDKIVIRKARYDDIAQIVDINIKDWKTIYKGIIDDEILENLHRDDKIEKWKNNDSIQNTIVAEKNGKVWGYCTYNDHIVDENTHIDSEIIALYVDCDKLREGIGTKLLEYVVADLRNKGKNKMVIWCLKDNRKARNFYEKMGGILLHDEKYFEKEGKAYKEVGYVYMIAEMHMPKSN